MHTTPTNQTKNQFATNIQYPQQERENPPSKTLEQCAQDNNESYRYYRYKRLTIKHIDEDRDEDSPANYYEQQTCMETAFHQPPQDPPPDRHSSRKVHRLRQNSSKYTTQESQPGINNRWEFTKDKHISQICIERLKNSKSEAYQQIVNFFNLSFRKQSPKQVLYLYGEKQTGKKTLVYEALSSSLLPSQKFYLNFSLPSQKYKQQTLNLYRELKRSCHMQLNKQQERKTVLVINNVQIFIYFLKKAQIYHQFKVLMRSANLIVVLVDRLPLDNKQLTWISQNSECVHVLPNSKDLFLSSLLNYFADFKTTSVQLVLPKPLANYFTTKLNEQNCLQLGMISKFAHFVLNSQTKQPQKTVQNQEKPLKAIQVTRQLIEAFKKLSLANKSTVQLQHLNLHQKLVLVTCYIYLTEHDQVAIPLSQSQKIYKWACTSSSIQAKTTKQLQRDVLHNLETYRLVRVLRQFGKSKEKHIIVNIDLCRIKEGLQGETFLHKFFNQK